MREIKFRGIHFETKEFVYGDLVNTKHFKYIINKRFLPASTLPVKEFSEVVPETVGQFTGLQDKNGVDIYEGDIVNDQIKDFEIRKSVVLWDESNPCFVLKRIDNRNYFTDYEYDFVKCGLMTIEVVGNIHENY